MNQTAGHVNETFSVKLEASASSTSYQLSFRKEDVNKKQARFEGRYTLVPEIDLGAYTCRAVIDWLEFRISIDGRTQWLWVQDHIEKQTGERVYVKDITEADSSSGRRFTIRFQEPHLGSMRTALDAVETKWKLACEPELVGLEISLDLFPKIYSEEALALLFGAVVRTHLPSRDVISEPHDRPRFVASDGHGVSQTRYVLAQVKRAPQIRDNLLQRHDRDMAATFDSTHYTGAQGSASSWRTMIKRVDRQNRSAGTFQALDEEEHRVRLEVTLLEPELRRIGLCNFDDLRTFKFQRLQGSYFQFRLPTFRQAAEVSALGLRAVVDNHERKRLCKFLKAGVVGLEAMDMAWDRQARAARKASSASGRPRRPPRRGSRLTAYEQLSLKVVHALRHLGDRQRESLAKRTTKRPLSSY